MSDFQTRSFWLGRNPYQPSDRLDGDTSADIVIVGGGFTGLWSAIMLKEADPAIDIAIVEQKVIGYGASGRNGGFAMTMVARNLHDLVHKVGPDQARATHVAMVESINAIEEFATTEGIDADITHPGNLTVSNGPEQDSRIEQDVRAAERLGLDDYRFLDRAACQELVVAPHVRMGHFEDHTLLVDPAALARGLKDAACRRGVRVYESTPVDEIESIHDTRIEARTPFGTVHGDRLLIATNAYAHSIPAIRRWIFTIYAYITLTEPLTDEQWERIGWEQRFGMEDKRVMLHFHRPTADGRILWGGRDAPFKPGGPNPTFDRDPYIFGRLEETFRWNFPALDDVGMEHAWAGPVCGTLDCIASVGWLQGERILYALGYAGHGVGPSHLAARIVRDRMLNRQTELTGLPLVTSKPKPLPPGPLRRWMLDFGERLVLEMDDNAGEVKSRWGQLASRYLH